jgi:adenylosuccinate lyase
MAAVQAGGDRQELHERIRQHSQAVTEGIKEGRSNDLIERLRSDPAFASVNFTNALKPQLYVGRSSQQVEEYLREEVEPLLQRYHGELELDSDVKV